MLYSFTNYECSSEKYSLILYVFMNYINHAESILCVAVFAQHISSWNPLVHSFAFYCASEFILSIVGEHLDCFQLLLIMNNGAINFLCIYLLGVYVHKFLGFVFAGVKLLGQRVCLFLSLLENPNLLKVIVFTPMNSLWVYPFLNILANSWCCQTLNSCLSPRFVVLTFIPHYKWY